MNNSDPKGNGTEQAQQFSRRGFRAAVREFNRFVRDCPPIGSASDPVGPNERVYKRLIFDRKNRTYREEYTER